MKPPTTLLVLALTLGAVVNAAETNTPETAPSTTAAAGGSANVAGAGTVQAMIVVGGVQVKDAAGNTTPLKRGNIFAAGATVTTSKGANALLVLSNGATIKVQENSQLIFTKLDQWPYSTATEGTYLRLTRDPSKSITEIKLNDGSMQFEAKKLNTAAGSSFEIATPAGVFSSNNGGITSIRVSRDAGSGIAKLVTIESVIGEMKFIPTMSAIISSPPATSVPTSAPTSINIPSGESLTINLRTDPTTGAIADGSVSTSTLSVADGQGTINDLYIIINQASVMGYGQPTPVYGPTAPSTPTPSAPATSPAQAATSQASIAWPAGVPMLQGKVQAMIVVGAVNLVARDGTITPLKRGQTFAEGTKIVADKGANALLVFSNGATVKVKEGTTMTIVKFRQAPFDEKNEGTFLRLTKDPSRSNTVIEVSNGVFQGEVKKLDTEAGSSFVVISSDGAVVPLNDHPNKSSSVEQAGWKLAQIAGE
ncbi:MAG TPA: FecR domain-containing protein [Opitutales bacterium]|jgi:hypothetical protein|nr:FecR domain-containing protein [Opitutales bacterium]